MLCPDHDSYLDPEARDTLGLDESVVLPGALRVPQQTRLTVSNRGALSGRNAL
jgi:hypothetical protein